MTPVRPGVTLALAISLAAAPCRAQPAAVAQPAAPAPASPADLAPPKPGEAGSDLLLHIPAGRGVIGAVAVDALAATVLWDEGSGPVTRAPGAAAAVPLAVPKGPPTAPFVVSPDGRRLAAAWGRRVLVIDPATGAVVREVKAAADPVDLLALDPAGRTLAVGGTRRAEVEEIDVDTGTRRSTRKLARPPAAIAYADTGFLVPYVPEAPPAGPLPSAAGRGGADLAVAVPAGDAPGGPSVVELRDGATGALVHRFEAEGDSGRFRALAFTPDARYLVAGGDDGLRIWELDGLARIHSLPQAVVSLSVSPAGDALVIGLPGQVGRWNHLGDVLAGLHRQVGMCVAGDCSEGPGSFVWGAERYDGVFHEGLWHGRGVYLMADGRVWDVIWNAGQADGPGVVRGKDGAVQILGTWKAGAFQGGCEGACQDGRGKAWYPDGTVYEGTFVGGKRDGEGRFVHPDGATHTGRFRDDQPHGSGELRTAQGEVRRGSWIRGHFVGPCLSGDCEAGEGSVGFGGDAVYTGPMRRGLPEGKGKATSPSGGWTLEASFASGVAQGEGMLRTPNGAVFVGLLRDNTPVEGEIRWPEGGRWVGPVKGGKAEGRGTYYFPNGATVEGEFADGNLVRTLHTTGEVPTR